MDFFNSFSKFSGSKLVSTKSKCIPLKKFHNILVTTLASMDELRKMIQQEEARLAREQQNARRAQEEAEKAHRRYLEEAARKEKATDALVLQKLFYLVEGGDGPVYGDLSFSRCPYCYQDIYTPLNHNEPYAECDNGHRFQRPRKR
jgi:hypothetical protein